jgi:ABC-type amino acid transport system permease subunit
LAVNILRLLPSLVQQAFWYSAVKTVSGIA